MKIRFTGGVLLLAMLPVVAEEVAFNGRTLEVSADQASRPILRVSGSRYAIPRAQAQLFERAKSCLASTEGVVLASEDAAQGVLAADLRTGFRAGFASRSLRSRLELTVGDGVFQLTETELLVATDSPDGEDAGVLVPLAQGDGLWQKGLTLLIERENGIVDCLYR